MKQTLFLIGLMLCCSLGLAENGKGLSYRLIKEGDHQIHLLDIDPKYYKIVLTKADPKKNLQTVSALAKHFKAKAGINGGYFDVSEKGSIEPVGALKINGVWFNPPTPARAAIGWESTGDVVLIDRIQSDPIEIKPGEDPDLMIVFPSTEELTPREKLWQRVDNILGGVGLLIQNKQPIKDFTLEKANPAFLYERHARTAVCIKDNKHWLWLVVPHTKTTGRKFTRHVAEGFTIPELTSFLQKQGCVDAINLDGGGSSTMVMNNKILNWPVGDSNDKSHLYEERKVSEAILVVPKH